ncbi:type II secretion system F family protein [Candidatus Micrarchaeota archaeon]|nr:type II secretion system F family protein [Candidatus Micrarchaeota archaeon]
MKISKEMAIVLMISLAVFIIFLALRLFAATPNQKPLFEIMMIVGALFPVMIYSLIVYGSMKSKEAAFPTLIGDIANNLQIGISLVDTIEILTKNNYKALTKDVRRMYRQITWGVTFSDAFRQLCENSHSSLIRKSGDEIISTLDSGGELSKVLAGIATSMKEYQSVMRERRGQVYEQMLTGYMVFFIFLGIIYIIVNQLLPFVKVTPLGTPSAPAEVYRQVLFHFCLIEAVCIAFVTGEMGEGSITAGFKHVLVLVTATVILFSIV